jgi:hypothetical protein
MKCETWASAYRRSRTAASCRSFRNRERPVLAGMRQRLGADRHDPAWTGLATERQYFYVLLEFKIAVERYKYFAYAVRAAQ